MSKLTNLSNPVFQKNYRKTLRVLTEVGEVSKTHQSFVSECDVNNVVRKYRQTGMFPTEEQPRQYLDTSSEVDFQSALHIVMQAESAFASLPATVRKRFDNDPTQVINFISDPSNHDECVKLGLKNPKLDVPIPPVLEPHITS